ncbi:MAG TPA: hypothetical protein VLN44_12240 [Pyrinomonadaceae bacterium]|nr:hypothetical protein [Pyrinomonadaceae bacterium]
MDKPKRRFWLRTVLVIGAFYCTIGIAFGAFAGWSTSNRMVVGWRVASFVISAIVFAIHIGYEHFGLANRPLIVALHASVAVALGAFGLAVGANINSIGVASSNHRLLAAALVIWPVMTGIPAFVVAIITAGGLHFFRRANVSPEKS